MTLATCLKILTNNKVALFILSILRDIRYVFKVAFLTITNQASLRKPIILNEGAKKTPIILVHGSGGTQLEWIESIPYTEKYLPDHPIYAFSLDYIFDIQTEQQTSALRIHSIEQYAERLSGCINWVLNQTYYNEQERKQVCLIGHSMGGLIASYYAKNLASNLNINSSINSSIDSSINSSINSSIDSNLNHNLNRNITVNVFSISSPYGGAPLLNYKIFKTILNTTRHKQMTPKSEFLTNLTSDIKEQYSIDSKKRIVNCRTITFGSEQDIHVPDSYAKSSDANYTHITCNGYGHFSIVSAEKIWKAISNLLTREF